MKPSLAEIILIIRLQLYSASYQPFKNTTCSGTTTAESCTTTCSNVYSLNNTVSSCRDYGGYNKTLNITESNVTVLHSGDFFNFEQTYKLYLIGIHIEEIQPGAFNGLSELSELNLRNNHLKVLSNGVFNNLTKLFRLDLSNNSISHIEAKVFLDLKEVVHIDLQLNQLTTIGHKLFDDQYQLNTLNLSGNPLHLSEVWLGSTSRLELLDISNISLTDADLQSFVLEQPEHIHTIKMSSNLLTNPDCAILPNAFELDLSNNALVNLQNIPKLKAKSIDLDNTNVKLLDGFSGYYLYLSNNGIETISKNLGGEELVILDLGFNNIAFSNNDTFGNLSSLDFLYLDHNKISTIPVNLFQNMRQLSILDLSFNLIENFQDGTFDSLTWLQYLNIAHNRFTTLPHHVFTSSIRLGDLRFDFNNISTLNVKELFKDMSSLRTVYLDEHNFECEQFVQIYKELRSANVEVNF